jgi:hypothetical protein
MLQRLQQLQWRLTAGLVARCCPCHCCLASLWSQWLVRHLLAIAVAAAAGSSCLTVTWVLGFYSCRYTLVKHLLLPAAAAQLGCGAAAAGVVGLTGELCQDCAADCAADCALLLPPLPLLLCSAVLSLTARHALLLQRQQQQGTSAAANLTSA